MVDADVVVENWRPDVKDRLGLSYEKLSAINPRIILASISGFGQNGPYAGRPGFDQIIQGMGGLMSVTGFSGGGPLRAGLAVADCGTGIYAAVGILLALLEREHSGLGQWIHSSLLHTQIALMDFQAARYLNEGDLPVQVGNDHPTSSPMGLFNARDGAFNLGASGEGNWKRLCDCLGEAAWLQDPRYASEKLRVRHRTALNEALARRFRERDVAHWVKLLNDAGVPAGPVYSMPEVFDDPQVRHLGVAQAVPGDDGSSYRLISQPVTLERTPAGIARPAPGWGEHTQEVLAEIGYGTADVQRMRSEGWYERRPYPAGVDRRHRHLDDLPPRTAQCNDAGHVAAAGAGAVPIARGRWPSCAGTAGHRQPGLCLGR